MEEDPEAGVSHEEGWGEGHTWRAQFRRENLPEAIPPLLSGALLLGAGSSKELEEGVSGRETGKQVFQGSNLGCGCFRMMVILTTTGNRYGALPVIPSFADLRIRS